MPTQNLEKVSGFVERVLQDSRVPGAALAVVMHDRTVYAAGHGYRDLASKLPMSAETVYPIASTTKALNSTLLGMLIDEGRLSWDTPIQALLPGFRLADACASSQITVRDLVTMRTGLPRHDWLSKENGITRSQLVHCIQYLQPSAGLRERFQYNNLMVAIAGHVAEVVTGKTWEHLIQRRIIEPLGMTKTGFSRPASENVSLSYHEDIQRRLVETKRIASDATAPAGSTIHSTVEDMARWIVLNLNSGEFEGRRIIESKTLSEIHSPQILVGPDSSAPTPQAAYGMGWFVDNYNGHQRVSHGGYHHDFNGEVMLFPKLGIGIVSFINFGPPKVARLICEHAFDLMMNLAPVSSIEQILTMYETRIANNQQRIASVPRVPGTHHSHSLHHYAGTYSNKSYGEIDIRAESGSLVLRRSSLSLPLEHWHYDAWVAAPNSLFPIQEPQAFDRANRILFETNADGDISTFSIQLEPAVAPIIFVRKRPD